MKKKFLTAVMMGAMVFALTACGAEAEVQDQDAQEETQEEVQTETVDLDNEESDAETDAEAETDTDAEAETDADVETDTETVVNAEAPDFAGSYYEEIAGRGMIDIESTGDNTYAVSIHWGASAFESANWEMTATYSESTGLLEYTDCTYTIITFEDEENYTEDVKYTDGAGEFWFTEDGKLGWKSANSDIDSIDGESVFLKEE